jgi:alkanesulfonate monooxygenase SsuD/methylene tetrahydromethanopterin reductase-like flavin-dependent oxidoreductase (luciferase family)
MRSRYGRDLEFGLSIVPASADVELARELARVTDALGLDVIGIQDHPYQWRFLETWSLIGDLLARTERVRLFPDVANLPLRLPAMIAKHAASLDVLSGGRFELGLGAGAFWEAIGAMGGPVRSGGPALKARHSKRRYTSSGPSGAESERSRSRASTTRCADCIPARRPRTRSGSGSAWASRERSR